MGGSTRVVVVVPCYNEASRLPVGSFETFFAEYPEFRFLFVNDGSSDDTLGVLQKLQIRCPSCVDVLNQERNQGKAEAVRCGLLRAISVNGAGFAGYWDADLATPLSELPRLFDILLSKPAVEMLLGSRVNMLGRRIQRRSTRHYFGRIFATFTSSVLDIPVYDTQCGAKLLRLTPAVKEALATPFQSRWVFDVELIARFLRSYPGDFGQAVAALYEEPLLQWTDVDGSKVKLMDGFKAFKDLFDIRRRYRKRLRHSFT
ncbi:MAG: glycosyltransferase [Terracidiphilus sp.]